MDSKHETTNAARYKSPDRREAARTGRVLVAGPKMNRKQWRKAAAALRKLGVTDAKSTAAYERSLRAKLDTEHDKT